jgi:hypothetical protein
MQYINDTEYMSSMSIQATDGPPRRPPSRRFLCRHQGVVGTLPFHPDRR